MVKSDKTLYDKKIVYLDYIERGEKVKNGGFLKWETRENMSRISIQIRGLYPTDTLQGEILLLSKGELHAADSMRLNFGTGEYAAIWRTEDLAGSGISLKECDGIVIKISEKRLLKGQWRESVAKEKPKPAEVTPETLPEIVQETAPEVIPKIAAKGAAGSLQEIEPEIMPMPEKAEGIEQMQEIVQMETATAAEPQPEPSAQTVIQKSEPSAQTVAQKPEPPKPAPTKPAPSELHETSVEEKKPLSSDKWEQLNRVFPKIHPFGDDREYLSIKPRDFVILSGKYQGLVQNSFLLHGYYNYGHVILTRVGEKEESYYLGVPGVYFDREKQAALMFGFEGFEAGGEKATDGGFGYYMKQVEI